MKSRRNREKRPSRKAPCGRTQAQLKCEEAMLEKHLPLVRAVVNRIAGTLPSHVCRDDLESAGLAGLHSAVRGYDSRFGTTFEMYARVRIRGAILDKLRELDWVPRSVHTKTRKVETARQKLEQVKGIEPTKEEMAKELRLSTANYEALCSEIQPITLIDLDCDNVDSNGDGTPRYESIVDEKQTDPSQSAITNEMARLTRGQLWELPEKQRRVVALYYFEDLRLREIAKLFGLTKGRICQIHAQAIRSLRRSLVAKGATAA